MEASYSSIDLTFFVSGNRTAYHATWTAVRTPHTPSATAAGPVSAIASVETVLKEDFAGRDGSNGGMWAVTLTAVKTIDRGFLRGRRLLETSRQQQDKAKTVAVWQGVGRVVTLIDWSCLVLSVICGVLLGLATGGASHWAVGISMFMGWMMLHGLTWGFVATPVTPRETVPSRCPEFMRHISEPEVG